MLMQGRTSARSMASVARGAPLALLLLACGSASKKQVEAPAPTAAELARQRAAKERAQLDRDKPPSPLVARRAQGFRAEERCGQGPYRFEVDALQAPYSESFELYVCGPREVSGVYRVEVKRPLTLEPPTEERFGGTPDNRECVAGAEERVVQLEEAPAPSSPAPAGKGKDDRKRKGLSPAKPKEPPLPKPRTLIATAVPVDCRIKRSLLHHTRSTSRGIAMRDAKIVIDVWSEVPNFLEGTVFVLAQRGTPDDMTEERWAAYQKAEREWYERYHAFTERELASGRSFVVEREATLPPPPARRAETPPPKPSQHATWVPGYWHFEDGDYHWLAGLWRVPAEDVAAKLTAVAPRPPPPPRVEAAAQRAEAPSRRAVWTPGSWQWDGRAYVWIDGAWRIPPQEGQRWTPPAWEVRVGGGVALRPGGWSISIRR
jgi:WXXGXW repeat (2 copies)